MPIDKAVVDSMLNPFRGMMKDADARGLKGEAVDKMRAALQTMEKLAKEMDDLVSYSTKLSSDNLYLEFSNNYSKAMMAGTSSARPQDDESLLKQTLAQYETSLKSLKNNPDWVHLVPPLEKCIKAGKSGVSYPVFLRMCEEQGIFEEMKNGDQRPLIEFELHVATVMYDPLRKELNEKLLKAHDEICKKNALGLIDYVEFEMLRYQIQHEYAPKLNRWQAICWRWDRLIDLNIDWLDSFTAFAPTDERWKGHTDAQTKENIEFTQECQPGLFKVRENIFQEYFDLTWKDIFNHETYLNELAAARIWHSDERIELAKATYPHIKPGSKPPKELIAQSEDINKGKRMRSKANSQKYGDGKKPEEVFDFKKFSDFVRKKKI